MTRGTPRKWVKLWANKAWKWSWTCLWDMDMGLGNGYLHRTLARFCGLCTRAIKWFLREWSKKINYKAPLGSTEQRWGAKWLPLKMLWSSSFSVLLIAGPQSLENRTQDPKTEIMLCAPRLWGWDGQRQQL